MTLLEINLTDVLLETDPDDKVVVWAPVLREGPTGQLVGTRRKSIPLVDGVGSDEVVPGPLMVQVQCKAMSDARPREVVVPEEGPVTLTALMDGVGAFTYAPPVVGRVAQYRDEAIQAAADAEDAAGRAGDVADAFGSLDGVEDLVQAASDSALGASGSASAAASSASAAATSEGNAAGSADSAASSASAAATSEANAGESENVALDASAAAIAAAVGVAQSQGQGFPNGKVAAPVGSIYTDTLATAGAIRWIKASGTGNTGWRVMDGDTGTRVMPDSMMENGWTIKLRFLCTLRRVGNVVSVSWDVTPPFPNHDTIGRIPAGFRPSIGEVNILTPAGLAVSTAQMNIIVSPDGEWRRYEGRSSDTTSPVSGSTSWITTDPWPTSLPGTPA